MYVPVAMLPEYSFTRRALALNASSPFHLKIPLSDIFPCRHPGEGRDPECLFAMTPASDF